MTFAELKLMLSQDVNRSDKETLWYPIWINRALRQIQSLETFSCMKSRSDVTVASGASSAALPARFKQLTPEQYPISVLDPTLGAGVSSEVPCEVTSREDVVAHRASTFVPSRPANVRGRLSGLPVWIENTANGWTLNIIDTADGALTFRVSHFAFLPDLAADSDTNYLTINYPGLVENKVKAIAFAALNDPIAAQFEAMAARLLSDAVLDDNRRMYRGRALRMGG